MKVMKQDELMALIEELVNDSRSIQERVQDIGLQIIYNFSKDEDVKAMNKLYDDLPNGVRKEMLKDWFKKFGGVKYVEKLKSFKKHPTHNVDMVGAKNTKWWTMRGAEKDLGALDIAKLYFAIRRKIDKAQKEGREIVAPEGFQADYDAMFNKYKSEVV